MLNPEFSDAFDTLLNSYNLQADFGEGSNKQGGITLDEYEKSVLLTQAQDIIVKSYFDRSLNQQGQGIDDSTRRQVDFSSLIKVARYSSSESGVLQHVEDKCYDDRGLIVNLGEDTKILFILNEKIEVGTANKKTYVVVPINYREYDREMSKAYAQPLKKQAWRLFSNSSTGYDIDSEIIPIYNSLVDTCYMVWSSNDGTTGYWVKTTTEPVIGNEDGAVYIGEFDTEDDLPTLTGTSTYQFGSYAKILEGVSANVTYVIRYVQRPTPIVLQKLPNGLTIDGESDYTECSLNPILHMDILNKAFELAITTREGGTVQRPNNNNQ